MDQVIQTVYARMLTLHRCSVDDILESPELRNEYLTSVRDSLGDLPEQQLLHRLTTLRKRSKLARRDSATCNKDSNSLFEASTSS